MNQLITLSCLIQIILLGGTSIICQSLDFWYVAPIWRQIAVNCNNPHLLIKITVLLHLQTSAKQNERSSIKHTNLIETDKKSISVQGFLKAHKSFLDKNN